MSQEEYDYSMFEDKDIDYSMFDKDPTLGQTATALGTEVAVGEGAKLAGAAYGSLFGPAGVGIGYAVGGITGGISGSIAAQRIEGRDDISWGRVTADTLLNLIPGGLGKAGKATKVVPKIVKGGIVRGAEGALISTGAAAIEKGIEEGELLTEEEFLNAAKTGAALNIGFKTAGELLKKAYPKFSGKSAKFLNDAYEKGDPEATQLVETIAGENPVGKGSRMRKILERVYPSKLTGKRTGLEIIRAQSEAEAAKDLAATIKSRINKFSKGATDAEKKLLDDYVTFQSDELPQRFEDIRPDLNDARDKIEEYQKTILTLYKNGELEIPDVLAKKIEDSLKSRNYFTREYRLYEDASYSPSAESINNLKQSLMQEKFIDGKRLKGMSDEASNEFIQKILDNRKNTRGLVNTIYSNKRVLRKRKDLSKEMREFLGEYKDLDVEEKMVGTITRLGRLAAEESGTARVVNNLVNTGIAQKFDALNVPEGFEKLTVRNKDYDLYVPSDVNKALDNLYNTGVPQDTGNFALDTIRKIMATGTAGAKFARVPLNAISYPVQLFGNLALVVGQGMNPARGFGKGLKIAINEALPKSYRMKSLSTKELNRLKELNLVNKGVRAQDIQRGFDVGFPEDKFKKGKLGFFNKTLSGFGSAYNVYDTASRISVFENYKHFLRKIIPEEKIESMGKDFDQLAADLTNDTYMNYDRISKGLRALSRYGILNEFGAFNFELTRTTYNQAKLIKSLNDGTFAKNLSEELDIDLDPNATKILQEEGRKRLVALSFILGLGSAAPTIANREGGVSEEIEIALRETVLAPWEIDQALTIDKDGDEVKIANIGYQIPTAELTSVVESALRGEDIIQSSENMMNALYGKFGGDLTIAAKNFFAAYNGYDLNGNKISNKPDRSFGRIFDSVGWYLADTYTPGTITDLKKLDERTTLENALRYLVGYRMRTTGVEKGAGFKFKDISERLRSIRSQYSSSVRNSKTLSDDYKKLNADYRNLQQETIGHINNLRTLGKTDEEIYEIVFGKIRDKDLVQNMLKGGIEDMSISSLIPKGKKNSKERVQAYFDISNKLPIEMTLDMLMMDQEDDKISRSEVRTIINAIKLMQE